MKCKECGKPLYLCKCPVSDPNEYSEETIEMDFEENEDVE